jgi:hypothetical protein
VARFVLVHSPPVEPTTWRPVAAKRIVARAGTIWRDEDEGPKTNVESASQDPLSSFIFGRSSTP